MQTRFHRLGGLVLCALVVEGALAEEDSKRPIDGIMDNSFFIEEAYNQEKGVVQHILNGAYGVNGILGRESHALAFSFTQEWPVFSQSHQFSYSIPYSALWDHDRAANGLGDVLLNYRYQVLLDERTLIGFAPRFSLVLPTGDRGTGFGNGALGYQWNLPFSTTLGDRWFAHLNAGLTYLPGVGSNRRLEFLNYNLGASAIYCVSDRFNLMLEWIGLWTQFEAETGGRRREFSSVISPGVRYAFNFRNGSQLVLGLGIPIGLTGTAPDLGAFVYLSFEHNFL